MRCTQKHRKPTEDFEIAPDKSSRHKNDSFTAQQPPHPTGYQSTSVRPVCFPHCSLRAEGAAGKHGPTATSGNRNDICTRFNKTAACYARNDPDLEKPKQVRRIISPRSVLRGDVPPRALETVKNTAVSRLQLRLPMCPVRGWHPPNAASTGGMLPVNMCGPAAQAGCNWSVQHTPPQAPTAPPPPPPTGGSASREDAPFKTMTQGLEGNEKGGRQGGGMVEGKKGK